jgi:hypothetical protein
MQKQKKILCVLLNKKRSFFTSDENKKTFQRFYSLFENWSAREGKKLL